MNKTLAINNNREIKDNKRYKKEKDVLVIYIHKGIIGILVGGEMKEYRQKGISNMPNGLVNILVNHRVLDSKVMRLKTIPSHYRLYFEDEEIMGIPEDTFNYRGV